MCAGHLSEYTIGDIPDKTEHKLYWDVCKTDHPTEGDKTMGLGDLLQYFTIHTVTVQLGLCNTLDVCPVNLDCAGRREKLNGFRFRVQVETFPRMTRGGGLSLAV